MPNGTHRLCSRSRIVVKMDDGTQVEYGPGDAFYMPPGHDAWYRCREWSRTMMVGEITRKRQIK
jgi:uncharacterized cupin superfamily protein